MTKKVTPVLQENTEPATGNVTDQAAEQSSVQEEALEFPKEASPISEAPKDPVVEDPTGEDPDDAEDKALERIKEVFASHDVNEIHMTSDGTCFIEPQHARMHSENLEDPRVLTIKRQEV